MAVNIFAIEFRKGNFLEAVFAVPDDTGLHASLLELELTESVLMKQAKATESILSTTSQRSNLAVHDFGTGYSSLSYLKRFPVDILKIDRSFVRQITTAANGTKIVAAIIDMGRSLDLEVVAGRGDTGTVGLSSVSWTATKGKSTISAEPVNAERFADLLETGIKNVHYVHSQS